MLPRSQYAELDNDVLGQLLRTLNPEELKRASGDIFGRIYEYFLTQFADLKAHDGGEFFTPVSLVQMIANVIEPDHGKVLDPACGSGGMFVQSAHFVERLRRDPTRGWQTSGYWVELFFLNLPSVEIAIRRVKERIAQGGHDVPEDVIRRRFGAGLANFRRVFVPLVDGWKLYDNSGPKPVLLEWGERHPDLIGADAALERAAKRALELALQTGTSCWVLRDGKIVDIAAEARASGLAVPQRLVAAEPRPR